MFLTGPLTLYHATQEKGVQIIARFIFLSKKDGNRICDTFTIADGYRIHEPNSAPLATLLNFPTGKDKLVEALTYSLEGVFRVWHHA